MTIIANLSSTIHNNQQNYKHFFKCSVSKLTIEIATVLFKENFIRGFFIKKVNNKPYLYMLLKYGKKQKKFPKISIISKRLSNKKSTQILKYNNGLGLYIISTSKGLMTNIKASKLKLGGTIIIKIF